MLMIKQSRGFTIVELAVVVVVVSILLALVGIGIGQYQKMSRDAIRESSVTSVAEGLEKYYLQNGEYPSVPALTDPSPSNVAELIQVDAKRVSWSKRPIRQHRLKPTHLHRDTSLPDKVPR